MRYLLAFCLLAGCSGNQSFAPHPDGGHADMRSSLDTDALFGQCDPQAQTGCPAGQHCAGVLYYGNPANRCVADIPNPIPEGGTCTLITSDDGSTVGDSCAPGTACAVVGSYHKCGKYCYTRRDCSSGGVCAGPTNSPSVKMNATFGPEPLSACIFGDNCDPVAQTGCPDGQRCMFSPYDNSGRVPMCRVATGESPPESSCEASSQCAPGVICAGLGFCRQLCYRTPPDGGTNGLGSCPASLGTCNSFFGSGPMYGLCE